MKKLKKMMAIVLAVMVAATMGMAMTATAFAAPSQPSITIKSTADGSEASSDLTAYTWYQILEADIAEDPTQEGASQSDGKVSYYVTTQDRATQLTNTNLFNVTRVGTTNKWYVELKDESTAASTIAAAFAASTFDLSKFPTGSFAQTTVGKTATSGNVAAGYYYITSTAGTEAVIQTLTAVTIDEKNTFPPVEKTVSDDDKNAQIGDEIDYTLTVDVPGTANDKIVLTDTMTSGLTFKEIVSCKSDADGTPNVSYTAAPTTAAAITSNDNTFTITFDADTVKANQGKKITIVYKAVLNNKAVVGTADKNTVTLKYGNNYESKPKETETKTYNFTFDKVDGDNTATKLTGAEFQLTLDGSTPIDLIEVEAGKTYRIAMSEDTATPVTTITTNGNTVTINGLDSDVTYKLVETEAPTGGYNKLTDPIEVKASDNVFAHQDVKNNKGTVMPSTGGIGTTIFYILGAILLIGAGVVLIARRRMSANN